MVENADPNDVQLTSQLRSIVPSMFEQTLQIPEILVTVERFGFDRSRLLPAPNPVQLANIPDNDVKPVFKAEKSGTPVIPVH